MLENIFRLNYISYEDILSLDGFGEKSAKTLHDNIQKALKTINEVDFLASFGIAGWGKTMVDKALSKAGNLDNLLRMDKEELMSIEGVGEKMAEHLITGVKEQCIRLVLADYDTFITTPFQEHKNIAETQHENIVFVLVNTPKGQFKFPARPVAEHRANHYAEVDGHEKGSKEWKDEVLYALEKDTFELKDWLTGSTDWEDWKDSAEKVNSDVNVSKEDFWCDTDDFEIIEGEVAEQCKPKTICFTGKMPETRKFYEGIANERGLKPASSVNKDLDILVISEAGWTSGKVKKAEKYGTEIIPLEDWL